MNEITEVLDRIQEFTGADHGDTFTHDVLKALRLLAAKVEKLDKKLPELLRQPGDWNYIGSITLNPPAETERCAKECCGRMEHALKFGIIRLNPTRFSSDILDSPLSDIVCCPWCGSNVNGYHKP